MGIQKEIHTDNTGRNYTEMLEETWGKISLWLQTHGKHPGYP